MGVQPRPAMPQNVQPVSNQPAMPQNQNPAANPQMGANVQGGNQPPIKQKPKKGEDGEEKKFSLKKFLVGGFLSIVFIAMAAVIALMYFSKGDDNYKFTYLLNGRMIEVEVDKNQSVESIPTPQVKGYAFEGWYKDPTYTVRIEDDYSIDKDISAYPKFVPNKYQVTYNANDGVGSFLNQDVFYNDQYQVLANNFTKDNYTFVGWSTDKDAKYDANNLLKPNQEYTLFTEGLNLYAIWKGVDINVVFDDSNLTVDGNAYQLGDQVIPYGDYYTLPTFTGVAENSSDATLKFAGFVINGNVYQPGSQILVTEDLSITLNWQTANSVLNFNIQAPMGESVSNVDPMAFYIEQDSYLYEDIPTMSDLNNYNFVCWNTREDGSGQSFVAGENFETSEPFTVLYAIWQGKVREVNLYNDGELITTLTCRYGEYLDLPTYSLDKHTFIGFNSEEDNSGTTFNGRILMNFTGDVDLYAQYSRNQVTISFNANGGAGTIDNILINSEDIYTFNSDEILNQKTAITNKYYTLVGWSTNPDTNSDDASFEITTNTNNI